MGAPDDEMPDEGGDDVMHESCLHCDMPYLRMFHTPHGLRCNRCINEPMGGDHNASDEALFDEIWDAVKKGTKV